MPILFVYLVFALKTVEGSHAFRATSRVLVHSQDHRPMMGQVVHMLEGVMDVQVPHVPRSLQNYVGMAHLQSLFIFICFCISELRNTDVHILQS
jgi:hypothetical protein